MRSYLRLTGLIGAMLIAALWIAIPMPASTGHFPHNEIVPYNGIVPLSEIYDQLGVTPQGHYGCPNPQDFELLLEMEVNSIDADATTGMPAFTQVKGTLFPSIRFELRLPPKNEWNSKFYMAGCGGFCGGVDIFSVSQFTNNLNWGLVRGYASVTMDSGHTNMVDGVSKGRTYAEWALNNRPGEIDWGFRSVHEVVRVSKALICAFYQERPRYSYFAGCSTGGRMAVVEAMRYPNDFDGVISGAPALKYTGLVATWMSWVVQAVGTNDVSIDVFTAEDQAKIEKAVLETCDGLDGAVDGLISDPRKCPAIDFAALGFSGDKLAALNKLFSRPTNSSGEVLYNGALPYGSEFYWPIWLPGAAPTPLNPYSVNLIIPFNDGFLKYMAFEADDPTFTAFDFNFDTDPELLEYMGQIYNATTDLSAFMKAGGKILMYHGWADSIVPPTYTLNFYDRVAASMGGVKKIQQFYRLFMIPGMDHCSTAQTLEPIKLGTSIGLDNFDALTALEMWVEHGQAPASMEASGHTRDGSPISQVLYPYRSGEFPGKGRRYR